LGRLNSDGTLDTSFNPQVNGNVSTLAAQTDGKILVGGNFTSLGGHPCNYLGRLNADGTLDATFNASATIGIDTLAVQADQKVLVGGSFSSLGGQPIHSLGRLNSNGTLDAGFNPGATGSVLSLAVQSDGSIVMGGTFGTIGGQVRTNIARINGDGTLDTNFTAGANATVSALALQANGRILAGGQITTLAGSARNHVGRLSATAIPTQTLSYDGTNITWLRAGPSAEIWRATFEAPTNGWDWSMLSPASRISVGWSLSGVTLSPDVILRARGYAAGGNLNASGYFLEGYYGRPAIISAPASRTNNFGSGAAFAVLAAGTGSLSYQWVKDALPLVNGGQVAGANTTTLSLTSVSGANASDYSVIVSNQSGTITSPAARLVVLDPMITGQPLSQNLSLGQDATLNVSATGTPPLAYQWYKDGGPLPGQTSSTLTLAHVQGSDAGAYSAAVTNLYSTATSAVAWVSINTSTLDAGFNPQPNGAIYAIAKQSDGKVLVGGTVTSLSGATRSDLGRLYSDGTLDKTFQPMADGRVTSLIVQPDGKIVLGGWFTWLGAPRNGIARLNPDGSLDDAMNQGIAGDYSTLWTLGIQPDGKIPAGGFFIALAGKSRTNLGRLFPDGTLDTAFNPVPDANITSFAIQADGKIVIGGHSPEWADRRAPIWPV
jgi:uncharacterized delta-60 repeat protein